MAKKDATEWIFEDEWYLGNNDEVVEVPFTTTSKAYKEKIGLNFGRIYLDRGDLPKIEGLKLGFGNFNSGVYLWKDGKKQYLHRILIQSMKSSFDPEKQRVGFIDDNWMNCQYRNLFIYEPGDKPSVNKWKAKQKAFSRLKDQGLVRRA